MPTQRPGSPGPRPISIDRPDFDVSYQPGPEIKKPNGNNGGGNNGGGRPQRPGRRPCHGPTGWDLVAIGLATAAFVDGGVAQAGCSTGDCVTVGQPTCCGAAAAVDSQPVAAATVADDPVPPAASALSQLRVGQPFRLPAQGLGAAEGRVAVKLGAAMFDCRVTGWNETGLDATLPAMTLAGPVRAELIVALADGTLAAVLPVELVPATE